MHPLPLRTIPYLGVLSLTIRRLWNVSGSADSTFYLLHPLINLQVMVRDLEAIMSQLHIQSLALLPPNHDIRHLVRQILFLAAEVADRDRTPLIMSQKIVQLLYKTPSQLGREVYVALLDQLCRSFEDVGKEALPWLIYAEDEVSATGCLPGIFSNPGPQRKYNVPATITLMRSGLVDVNLQDQHLAKLLFTNPRSNLQIYVASLIRECLSSDPPTATRDQFTFCIEVLQQLVPSGKANDE